MNDHEHKYYLSGKTYTEFTPIPDDEGLYVRTEYAILSCNCGSVIRKVVKDD